MSLRIQRRHVPPAPDLTDLHPVLQRVLAARSITNKQQLDYSLQNLIPFNSLHQIESAVRLLAAALTHQWRIVVVADYDADGATSCALAIKALKQMGAQFLSFLVPNRERHGYGLSPEVVELTLAYQPQLLITVDNGIASLQGVERAKQYGIRVLITDHHLPGQTLPEADAIVNPNQQGDSFPCKHLAGVGVIFYVMLALRSYLKEKNWFEQQQLPVPNLANLLDLVALGTVADVVPLDYTNQILVEQGLRRIRSGHCCLGIQALIQVARRQQMELTTGDLAYSVAPRLNAAGRMDDMQYGIDCLLSEDNKTAQEYAENLNIFNDERRYVESEMQVEAKVILDRLYLDKNDLPYGLCLFDSHWHQGVVGILASRIKDRFHRPVIIFTLAANGELRGSGRSVKGVHLCDVLREIHTQHPDLITKFGGHAMAAGLSLPQSTLAQFQTAFDQTVRKYLTETDLQGMIYTDGSLQPDEFNLKLAESLKFSIPWGQNCPEPLFEGKFKILSRQVFKDKHLKMQVSPLDDSASLEAIAFNTVDDDWPDAVQYVYLLYQLEVNSFYREKTVRLLVKRIANFSTQPNFDN